MGLGVAGESPHQGAGNGDAVLELVRRLCDTLEVERVLYCHWKSNEALDRSATGDNDLDLLVRRRDTQRFAEILRRLGFKDALVPALKQLPGVFHAYGLDRRSGRLVHVHAHHQLVLGDDMTKNYRLPIEEAYLASAVQGQLFKVPSPEFEFAVFVIRMLLKHSTWDAIGSLQGSLSRSEKRELEYLVTRADMDRVRAIMAEHLPFIGEELWDRCVRCMEPACSPWFRALATRRLQRALVAHSRRPRAEDTVLRLCRRGRAAVRRFLLRRRSAPKRLDSGGALIAVVGGDGAGKSSVVEALSASLSKGFLTARVHLGKPPRSLTTIVAKGAMVVGQGFFGLFPSIKLPKYATPDAGSSDFPGHAWLLWNVLTARDRYRAYARARRLASNGALVVCDRYPLRQICLMDGARMTWLARSPDLPRSARYLVERERRYYDQILPPEILIVLRVDPDIAVARKTDEDETYVRTRSEEVWCLDWSGTSAIVIDAARPMTEVLSELRSSVWSRL